MGLNSYNLQLVVDGCVIGIRSQDKAIYQQVCKKNILICYINERSVISTVTECFEVNLKQKKLNKKLSHERSREEEKESIDKNYLFKI